MIGSVAMLADLGLFFMGLGVFFIGAGALWWVSLRARESQDKAASRHS